MFPKYVLVLFLVQFILQVIHGDDDDKFFRNDYSYLANTESFYKVHTLSKTWNEAKIKCEREGATLFYPDDEDEASEVIKYWNQTQPYLGWVFIGISAWNIPEIFETVDGRQIWDVYNNWDFGEPNNAGGVEGCVVLNKQGGLNDDNCSKKIPFICKKSLATLQWNRECHIPDQGYEINTMQDRCYKFHLTPMNWPDAYATCNSEQSYLAVINSDEEAADLINITAKAPKDNIKGDYLSGAVHLGFKKNNDGNWITVKGGPLHSSGYNKWGYAQPDGGNVEKCGSMFYNGELNDIGCNQKMFFICEHEIALRNHDITYKFGLSEDITSEIFNLSAIFPSV